MKAFNRALAIMVWIAGLIVGIIIASATERVVLMLLYWVIAFIAGSFYYTLSVILENQEKIQARLNQYQAPASRPAPVSPAVSAIGNTNSRPSNYDIAVRNTQGGDTWKCVCGRQNASYVYTCPCGRNKPTA